MGKIHVASQDFGAPVLTACPSQLEHFAPLAKFKTRTLLDLQFNYNYFKTSDNCNNNLEQLCDIITLEIQKLKNVIARY